MTIPKLCDQAEQDHLIGLCTSALSQSRIMGDVDPYFFHVAAALSTLLDNLHGKRQADWGAGADDRLKLFPDARSRRIIL